MTDAVIIPATPGADRIVRLFGLPVIAAFKRGGRWWVVVNENPEPVVITVEEYLNRKADER